MQVAMRLAGPDDAAACAAIYAHYVGTAVTFETEAPTAEEFAARIAKVQERHVWLVAEDDSGVLGYAYATKHRERSAYEWSVELAVYLRQGTHRRGLGRTLYERLIGLLRRQGYVNAYAAVTLPNSASAGLHESLGFTPLTVFENVGYKCGAWRDVGWWLLALNPHEPDPARPAVLRDALSPEEYAELQG